MKLWGRKTSLILERAKIATRFENLCFFFLKYLLWERLYKFQPTEVMAAVNECCISFKETANITITISIQIDGITITRYYYQLNITKIKCIISCLRRVHLLAFFCRGRPSNMEHKWINIPFNPVCMKRYVFVVDQIEK